MRVTFDPAKNARNVVQRGLAFELVAELDWESSVTLEDTRKDYGERRFRVLAMLKGRLHVAIVTNRGGAVHVISFRKANRKETRWYGQEERDR